MANMARDSLDERYDMDMDSLIDYQQMTSETKDSTSNNKTSISQLLSCDINEKQLTKKYIFISSTVFWKTVLLVFLISSVGYGILICFFTKNNIDHGRLKHQLRQIERKIVINSYKKFYSLDNHYRGQHKKPLYENTSIVTENIEEMNYFNVSCENATTTSSSSKLVIFSAIYVPKWDTRICQNDVTNIINRKCSSINSCLLYIVNDIFPKNPCHGNIKELIVTYTCTLDQYLFGPVLENIDTIGEDIIYHGNIAAEGIVSIEACGRKCLEVPGCAGVVYAPGSHLCWFKRSMGGHSHQENRDSMIVFNFQRPLTNMDDSILSTNSTD